jgi:calcineurin-like phosphoesterase family protein
MAPRRLASYRSFESFAEASIRPVTETPMPESADEEPLDPRTEAALRAQLSDALMRLRAEQQGRHVGVITSVQDQFASLLQSRLLEDPPDNPQILRGVSDPGGPVEEVKYDERDIFGWLGSLFTWWKKIRPEPWQSPPSQPQQIGDGERLKVALLSDWGTGLYGAPVIAKTMEAMSALDVAVHLGDVYYSGTKTEAKERFVNIWPKLPARTISRTLNGNHEMYTGGEGYFQVMLKAFGQSSSCCAIQTNHYLLVGLDSAYVDHDLTDDQVPWLEGLVGQAAGRKVILLSHHQPYSLLDNQGPKLAGKISHLLSGGRILAWYWGHEHRCVLYDKHPTWRLHGRCIGHGGYPHFRDKLTNLPAGPGTMWRRLPAAGLVPGALILDARNEYIQGEEEKYGANGFVTLELDGPRALEVIRAPDGAVLLENELR